MMLKHRIQRDATAQYPSNLLRSVPVRDVPDDVQIPTDHRVRPEPEKVRDWREKQQETRGDERSSRREYASPSSSRRARV